ELWHSHKYRRKPRVFRPNCHDEEGPVFQIDLPLSSFHFQFKNLAGDPGLERFFGNFLGREVWCLPDRADVYPVKPAPVKGHVNDFYQNIKELIPDGIHIPDTDISYLRNGFPPVVNAGTKIIKTMLGASVLKDGSILFGLFHNRAAQVYLVGNFNDWQCPDHSHPEPAKFLPLELYRGYYDYPNIWLYRLHPAKLPEEVEYQFYVIGGIPLDGNRRPERYVHDPFTRSYGRDVARNPGLVVDPTRYHWNSDNWKTPDLSELSIYEMNVYGFTEGDPDIPLEEQGRFQGVIRRIRNGYFRDLGVNALELMPTSEAPTMQGPTALGYDPCGFASIERDFGTPDDLRELVDVAHQNGLAVLLDLVFNHTANSFNPLWDIISDHNPGGFYFSGSTPWGNRVATEKEEVQDYLIDVCKLFLKEYRVDGFRFDATNSDWMDHSFLHRMQYEIRDRGFKPECILIAENLPNQPDLSRDGWNGFAQWADPFHDKIKALLREGVYQDWVNNSPEHLGDIFYYCRNFYAKHTNNAINYCESHDENSMPYEVATDGPALQTSAAKERKSRLGLMATIVALGQPMIYMGQEFDIDRPRNRVQFDWPVDLKDHYFYQWVRGLFNLRRRYPGLRMAGTDLIEEGRFTFIIGPWLEQGRGRTVIGWRSAPSFQPTDKIVVLLNFEPYDVEVGVDFGMAGRWVKLADIDHVNDLPPFGNNSRDNPATINTEGFFPNFVLPSSSGFIYKWEH
ncbi:MAG: alpha-amylase family glycosyl hydrolase, partial [Bacillota bacterium]